MSYDISLVDRVSHETLEVPAHLMTGGTFAADYDPKTGMFTPKPTTEAWLNITYNYSNYYYEATESIPEFHGRWCDDDDEARNLGIRGLYGKTGLESIPMLEKMIQNIKDKYPGLETDQDYWQSCPGNAIRPLYQLLMLAQMRPDGVWEGD